MLKRKVYQELLKWKENTGGKALCIIGARQIGKTTLIREFGKNEYEHFAEINFVQCAIIVISVNRLHTQKGKRLYKK